MPESLGVCSTVLRALYSPSRLPPIDFATRNPFRHRDTLVLVYRRRLAYFFQRAHPFRRTTLSSSRFCTRFVSDQ
ncbi:hypothetical protein CEP51_005402 [Fusarium floridanum]|uniref:Uncharacterized protein n=1 Tax=Fusarium floridanum TaxID=1325733 RepID=A0A428RX87_9HYPO|nr:hypothetical protein CEP51_005402 [Fusarium floridanum]